MSAEGPIDKPAPPPSAAISTDYSAVNEPLTDNLPAARPTAADLPGLREVLEKALTTEPTPGRIDCRDGLPEDLSKMNVPASYQGDPASDDRYFVQYFDATNPAASSKWWTPLDRGMQHVTVDRNDAFVKALKLEPGESVADHLPPGTPAEAVMAVTDPAADVHDDLALLIEWGDRPDYRIMKIPAGEQARYVESAAAAQHSTEDQRELPGGGPQVRLLDFDPKWEIRRDQIGAVYGPDPASPGGHWDRDSAFPYPRRSGGQRPE